MSSGIWLVRETGLNFWEGGEGVWLIYDGLAFHPYMVAKLLATFIPQKLGEAQWLDEAVDWRTDFPFKPF